MTGRLTKAYGMIDEANAQDPPGQAALYGQRMTQTLEGFCHHRRA